MTKTEYPYGRLTRLNRETREPKPGPWHDMQVGRYWGLGITWCGTRVLGWKAEYLADAPPEGEQRCAHCTRQRRIGQPLSYKARRR